MYYIFTDGSSSRINKSIGSSCIFFNEKQQLESIYHIGYKDKDARTGIAELIGVYLALLKIISKKWTNRSITIYSDSQYVVNELNIWYRDQILKNFWEVKNKELIIYILFLLSYLRQYAKCNIKLEWIKGHQIGADFLIQGNQLADEQAVKAHKDKKKLKNIKELEDQIQKVVEEEKLYQYIKNYYFNL